MHLLALRVAPYQVLMACSQVGVVVPLSPDRLGLHLTQVELDEVGLVRARATWYAPHLS